MGKRAFISEFDTAQIFRRYNAATVMGLLREVARVEFRPDWNVVANKLGTGISGPRECQALWRHIAYRKELAEFYANDEPPSDEDSDLEFELLPTPPVTSETNLEVVRWVKADMQRFNIGSGKKKGEAKKVETESKTRDVAPPADSNQGVSGSGRDGSQKGTLNAVGDCSTEASPPSGTADLANPECALSKAAVVQSERRKRKLWSPEEDQELLSAVEQFGEGNWTNILKGPFTHERTAAQLSQRWALIRKRRGAVQAAANRPTSSPSAEQGDGVPTPPGDQSLQTNQAQNGTSPAENRISTPQGASPPESGATTAEKGSPTQNGNTTADKECPAETGTSPVQNGGNCASISPVVPPNITAENGSVDEVMAPSTTTASVPSPSGCQSQDHASSSPNACPSKGVNGVSNGSVATPGCTDNVAQNGVGRSIRAVTNGGQQQALAGGAGGAARSPAGSSTAAEASVVSQARSASAKSVSASVGAGRLVASGVVVMSAAAAQTASVGVNETRQAVSLPSTLGTIKYAVRSTNRGGSSKAMTGPDPGVQAAAVAAGARIAPASTVLKAAHSGNVVHIRPSGVPVTKSGLPRESGMGHSSSGGSRGTSGAIVHYITTQKPAQQMKNQAAKANGNSQTSGVARSDSMSPSKSNPTPPRK